jgi:hypothetical protein
VKVTLLKAYLLWLVLPALENLLLSNALRSFRVHAYPLESCYPLRAAVSQLSFLRFPFISRNITNRDLSR